jgi:tetratricopeptide (TPR) repeat protein
MNNKLTKDLLKLIGSHDIKNEKDLEKFVDKLMNGQLNGLPNGVVNPSEIAQTLVDESYELDDYYDAKENIQQALMIDEECIEAYEFLATTEEFPNIALIFLEKAISIGKKKFGGKYLKENRRYFWGVHETRPYMRCLQAYAECLYLIGKIKEGISIMEELISLNPNDNQGIRDFLLLYLIEDKQPLKFVKYDNMFKDDTMTFMLFNRALFAYQTEGNTESATKKLKSAIQKNKHVAPLILSKKEIEETVSSYSIGSKDEAIYYSIAAKDIWYKIDGAVDWLKANAKIK